ncbi:MAG TPA: lasso RiPP family leader peptide-containing protein [Solirubrobacteraceae bacterium]
MDTKATYHRPTLTNYGSIAKLTQTGTSTDGGGGGGLEIMIMIMVEI